MSRKLVGKWFERGVEVGKTDGWMTVEDTIAEILERGQPQDAQDLVWRAIEEWEETDHFSIFYGSKMMEDARRDPDLYSEMKAEFWEGYLTGRKEIGVDIYKIAKALLPSSVGVEKQKLLPSVEDDEIYGRFRRNLALIETYHRQFHKIFRQQLRHYMDVFTGFDIVKFDKHLATPDGISTKEWIRQKYGEDAVALIETLIRPYKDTK